MRAGTWSLRARPAREWQQTHRGRQAPPSLDHPGRLGFSLCPLRPDTLSGHVTPKSLAVRRLRSWLRIPEEPAQTWAFGVGENRSLRSDGVTSVAGSGMCGGCALTGGTLSLRSGDRALPDGGQSWTADRWGLRVPSPPRGIGRACPSCGTHTQGRVRERPPRRAAAGLARAAGVCRRHTSAFRSGARS